MQANDIAQEIVPSGSESTTRQMLQGEIAGTAVFHHILQAGAQHNFPADPAFVRILFLCSGSAAFAANSQSVSYDEKAVFVPHPRTPATLVAQSPAALLEIRWTLTPADWAELENSKTDFPFTAKYRDAPQYRDPFKSEKTISRAIIPQRVLPRFAMGSVETYGTDLIGQHAHPLLDQFFFSFPENDMALLLNDLVYPMQGDTLLHIPLGCNHGVQVSENQCAHYIWIDFLIAEGAEEYLDEVHKATGTMRAFDEVE